MVSKVRILREKWAVRPDLTPSLTVWLKHYRTRPEGVKVFRNLFNAVFGGRAGLKFKGFFVLHLIPKAPMLFKSIFVQIEARILFDRFSIVKMNEPEKARQWYQKSSATVFLLGITRFGSF